MIDHPLYNQLAKTMKAQMQVVADLLNSQLSQEGVINEIKPAVWWNDRGLVVGSVSILTAERDGADSIDGVFSAKVFSYGVTIEADVCLSNGTLLCEVITETRNAKTIEELTEEIEESVRMVTPRLVSAMIAAVRGENLSTISEQGG